MAARAPILVGHDGSTEATVACSWAASLAAATGRDLVLAAVFSVGDHPGGPESAAAATENDLERWTATEVGVLPAERIKRLVVSGRPGPMLAQLATTNAASIVVVGTHHRPLAGASIGRVTQHLTFRSPCPIAVVPAAGGRLGEDPIVVGFDAADFNPEAVVWARSLADQLGVGLDAVMATAHASQARAAAEELFDRLPASAATPVRVTTEVGEPGGKLLAVADRLAAAAIVVGQRRDYNFGGRLMGRTTSWLLRHTDRPLIVHPTT